MKKMAFLLLIAGFIGSCAPVVISRAPHPLPRPEKGEKRGSLSLHALGIPPGHMPPPGSCRIWYPGRPPGHQPPPFRCGVGRSNIPLGSFLLQRLDEKLIQVDEYDAKQPNLVLRTGTFQLEDKKTSHHKGHKGGKKQKKKS